MKNKPDIGSVSRSTATPVHPLLPLIIGAGLLAIGSAGAQDLSLSISRGDKWEISFNTQTEFEYRIEATPSLFQPNWRIVAEHLVGTGTVLKTLDADATGPKQFYRAVQLPRSAGTISSDAVLPVPGAVYPEMTILGSSVLGLQYSVPQKWKGVLGENTSTMFFGSDTEPGLALAFISLAGTANDITQALAQDFYVGNSGGFQVSQSPQIAGDRIVLEWAGLGFDDQGNPLNGILLQGRAVVHPSGGIAGFAGFFTEANRAVMERVLSDFVSSTVMGARKTRSDLVDVIAGKAFAWVKSTNVGSGGSSGSLSSWKQNNAFFCPGTFEITRYSESTYSGNLSGGGFYSGGSSSQSTEAGDWTVIDTDSGPILVMISSQGATAAVLSVQGNSIFFGDQQFDYTRPHNCQ